MSQWHGLARVKFPLARLQAPPEYKSKVAIFAKESILTSKITVLEITDYTKRLMSETFPMREIFIITAGFYLAIKIWFESS